MHRRLASLLILAACGSGDDAPPTDPTWQLVHEHETAALLSVWANSSEDVWIVGGRTDLAAGPTVLHFTNDAFSRVDTGMTGFDLWWVFGFADGTVFFSGTEGTILRFRNNTFEKMVTPRSGTIFGIWGAASDDVWAVGDGGIDGGIVWHFDGAQWTEMAVPAGTPGRIFKVNGLATNDVWIACSDGSSLHWQGTSLERETTGVAAPLFSIVATASEIVAVGGVTGQGQITERTGAGWVNAPLEIPVPWRGAAAGLDGEVFAVGEVGVVGKRDQSGWHTIDQPLTQSNFHAAFVDPDGGFWGVGGDFERVPLTADGFITYFGTATIPGVQP